MQGSACLRRQALGSGLGLIRMFVARDSKLLQGERGKGLARSKDRRHRAVPRTLHITRQGLGVDTTVQQTTGSMQQSAINKKMGTKGSDAPKAVPNPAWPAPASPTGYDKEVKMECLRSPNSNGNARGA